jgi:hypothetical protein
MMRIEKNIQTFNPDINKLSPAVKGKSRKPVDMPIENPRENETQKAALFNSDNTISKPDLKDIAKEMLPKDRKIGSFEDKDQVGEAKDLQIGPDIRYALTTKNPEFLKRIVWGPLTSAEFREVYHKLNELERKCIECSDLFRGNIIDMNG